MFSEVTSEGNVRDFVIEIRTKLEKYADKPDAVTALKELGRFALTQFEFSTPTWAAEFEELFKE